MTYDKAKKTLKVTISVIIIITLLAVAAWACILMYAAVPEFSAEGRRDVISMMIETEKLDNYEEMIEQLFYPATDDAKERFLSEVRDRDRDLTEEERRDTQFKTVELSWAKELDKITTSAVYEKESVPNTLFKTTVVLTWVRGECNDIAVSTHEYIGMTLAEIPKDFNKFNLVIYALFGLMVLTVLIALINSLRLKYAMVKRLTKAEQKTLANILTQIERHDDYEERIDKLADFVRDTAKEEFKEIVRVAHSKCTEQERLHTQGMITRFRHKVGAKNITTLTVHYTRVSQPKVKLKTLIYFEWYEHHIEHIEFENYVGGKQV